MVADKGGSDIAFDYVLKSSLSGETPVRLEFDLSEPRAEMEYRVHVNGSTPLVIADAVRLTRRTETSSASARWQSII